DPGRSLGEHPDQGGPVVLKNGRYGPYVSHGGINATLPADKTPETITLEEAVGLLAARAEKVGNRPSARRTSGRRGTAAKDAETPAPTKTKAGKAASKTAAARKPAAAKSASAK